MSFWLAAGTGYSRILSCRLEARLPAGVLPAVVARRAAISLHATPFCLSHRCARFGWCCEAKIKVKLKLRPCCWLLNSREPASICCGTSGSLHTSLAVDYSCWTAVLSTA